MPETNERPKDPCVFVRSTLKKEGGKNKRGEPTDRIQVYIGGDTDKQTGEKHNDQIRALIAALEACLENPNGANLDLHISTKTSQNGRQFLSTFFFVKPTQDAPGRGPKTAAPTGQSLATRDRVERVRQGF